MVTLSIVFVNWNSTSYLRESIASVYQWTKDVAFEVIVVDNASPVRDVDVLKDEFPDILLLNSSKNLGFAGANNYGVKHSSGEFILFLNPDTKLIGPAIKTLLDAVQTLPRAGVVGCKLLNGDLSLQSSCVQMFPTILNQALDVDILRNRWPKSRLWGLAPLFSSNPEPAIVEVISGACMIIPRVVFETVGGFSEDYFMYAEDLDLCYKVVKAGYQNFYVGSASLVHYGGKSSTPQWATVRKWESIVQYCAKHHGRFYTLKFRFVMSCVAVIRIAILALASPLEKSPQAQSPRYSPSAKWTAILKTLLMPNSRREPSLSSPN